MEKVEYELNRIPIDQFLKKDGKNSRERLVARLGASGSWLDRVRRERTLPNGPKLAALADAIGVSVEELISRVPHRRRSA